MAKQKDDPGDFEDFDFSFDTAETDPGVMCPTCQNQDPVGFVTLDKKTIMRRAFSESKLAEIIPHNFEPGQAIHVLTGGDIDALSFLKHVVKQQNLEFCLFSTWCMSLGDVAIIKQWTESGKIGRLDAYVGEIFTASYSAEFAKLKPVVSRTGGRVCVFRNHSKIFAGIGEKFAFVIETSANINTNPRTENAVITVNFDLFKYYKEFFDEIKSFNREFDEWIPYKLTL
jgi:hypothetical protein